MKETNKLKAITQSKSLLNSPADILTTGQFYILIHHDN